MARASTASKPKIDPRIIIALASLIVISYYLLTSATIFRVGFPLDDTWIHLTYARNFAEHGEWAFRLGESSAGSTSPLWTFLLSIGYLLNLAPYAWTFFIGWLVLSALGIAAEFVTRKLVSTYTTSAPWVGIFFVMAWHLTWAAVSGMETLLHALLIFLALSGLLFGTKRYLALGFLAGLSVWVRPDGLTLLGPIIFTALFVEPSWSSRGKAIANTLLGFGALFFLYLLFNLALSGSPMPNTFYAKQAEYHDVWLGKPLDVRLVEYAYPFLASPFLALIPGFILFIFRSVRNRSWSAVASLLWIAGYLGLYFLRLPPYQHGRYLIPAFPILYLLGIIGAHNLIARLKKYHRAVLLYQTLIGALCIIFTFLGAKQNALDVYWIESEMVETAQWVQHNVPPTSILAVHDIGALGYYIPNPIVDLAGLITPEVIPFIRDEARLSQYLVDTSSDYLIVFRSDYPELTKDRIAVYEAGQTLGPVDFENNMFVFFLK